MRDADIRPGQCVPTDHRVTGVVCWPGQPDGTWEVWCRDGGASWVEPSLPAESLNLDPIRNAP